MDNPFNYHEAYRKLTVCIRLVHRDVCWRWVRGSALPSQVHSYTMILDVIIYISFSETSWTPFPEYHGQLLKPTSRYVPACMKSQTVVILLFLKTFLCNIGVWIWILFKVFKQLLTQVVLAYDYDVLQRLDFLKYSKKNHHKILRKVNV